MGRLAATPAAVLARSSVRTNHALFCEFPDGTWRGALRAVNSARFGHIEALILEWGGGSRGTDGYEGGLEAGEMSIRVADYRGEIAARSASGERLEGSAVQLVVLAGAWGPGDSPGWAHSDNPFPFVGVLERIERADAHEYLFVLRVPDLELRRDVRLTQFAQSDWPRAAQVTRANQEPKPDNVLGELCPVYYGAWNSSSAGGAGSVPTWNVDTRKNGNNGWCPMRYAGSVQRVYDLGAADPTEPVDPTTWSYSSVTRNGKVFTVIYKTSGKFIGPVTADIEGVLDGADLITNPARQLEHALSNLAWDGAAPLDPTWLDLVADLFDDLGLRGSFRAYQRESGIDLFDRWLAQWPFLRAVWGFSTGDALIEIFPLDWRTWSTPATWLRYWHRDDGSLMRISYDREQLSEIKVHYLANAAADAQLRTLVCANPDAPFGAAARGLESGLPATFG